MNELQAAIARLIERHGGLRAAAKILEIDPGYLSRLHRGENDYPNAKILRKLGLEREIVYRERRWPT
jgi:hypothetical protein